MDKMISNQLSSRLLTEVLDAAKMAAQDAGALIRARFGRPERLGEKTSGRDLVTEVDKECERVIGALIRTRFPDHDMLGEESVAPGSDASIEAVSRLSERECLWIVDPIDGTTSFIHGWPGVAVSIGFAFQGVVRVGVVYDPIRDELFEAVEGRGARCNGDAISVDQQQSLAESLLATGFPSDMEIYLPANLRGMVALSSRCRGIRSIGSAALHLASVAAGRLSGFWEMNLNSWDIAAGSLIVSEAGGTITDTQGGAFNLKTRHIAVTNGIIHGELLDVLAAADANGPLSHNGHL